MKQFKESYLNNKYSIINEGWSSNGGGFFAGIACFMNKLNIFSKKSDEKNPIKDAMKKIAQEKSANNAKRLKELKASKEGVIAQKLLAKHAKSENQLDLKNQRKINTYKAETRKLEDYANYFNKNKNIFTNAEMEAFDKKLDDEVKSLEGTDLYDECQKINDLRRIIATDENGNPRSIDDIKKAIEHPNDYPELNKVLTEFNDTVGNNENFKKFVKGDTLQEALNAVTNGIIEDAQERQHINEDNDTLTQEEEDFERKTKAVSTFEKMKSDYKNAKDSVENLKGEITELENKNNQLRDDIFTTNNENRDNVNIKDAKDNITNIITGALPSGEGKSNEERRKLLQKSLEEKGLPNKLIDNAMSAYDDCDGNTEDLKNKLDEKLTDDVIENSFNDLKESQSTAIAQKKAKIAEAEAKLDQSINPEEKLPEDMNADIKTQLQSVKEMSPENKLTYTEGNELHTEAQQKLTEARKAMNNRISNINVQKEAIKEKRKIAVETLQTQAAIPNELRKDIDDAANQQNIGEFYKHGKYGYYDPTSDNFIPKPTGENGELPSKAELDEYEKNKKEALLKTPADYFSNKAAEHEIISAKPDPNNPDKYILTYIEKNGKEAIIDGVSKKEAVEELANKNRDIKNKIDVEDIKKSMLSKIDKIIDKEGNIDRNAIKGLKPEDRDDVMAILTNIDSYDFKGIDTVGNISKLLDKDGKIDATKIKVDGVSVEKDKAIDTLKQEIDYDKEEDVDWDNDGEGNGDDEKEDDINLDDGDEDNDAEEVDDGNGGSKKVIKNPAKVWKRRKLKNGHGSTKNYYKTTGSAKDKKENISPKEYKEKINAFKEKLNKKKQSQNSSSDSKGESTTATDSTPHQESLNIQKSNLNESLTSFLKRNIK